MKKIILFFTFLFAFLFINSCKEDDTVSPSQENKPKITKWKIKTFENGETFETIFDIKYKNNDISILDVTIEGQKMNYIFNYENDKIKNIKGTDINNENNIDINFVYENNKLVEMTKFSNGEKIKTISYTYSGENITNVLATRIITFNDITNKELDTTIYSNFINGRPKEEKYRRFSPNVNAYTSGYSRLNKYENGNLIESYDNEDEDLILSNKNNYDLNKINYFEQFYFINSLIFDFVQVYVPGNSDKNLMLKAEILSQYCGRDFYNKPTEVNSSIFNYTYNNLGNVIKVEIIDEAICKEYDIYESGLKYLFELEWE